jgi:hypothetical protein
MFLKDSGRWADVMRLSTTLNTSHVSAHRRVQQDAALAYA